MFFRVTANTYHSAAIRYSQLHNSNVFNYQQQISSGLRFQRPSDAPLAFGLSSSLHTRYESLVADRSSIERSTTVLNTSSSQIQDFIDVVTKAKTLAQQGVQAFDPDEREALADEVDGLRDLLQTISLSRYNDQYLFGGTRSQAAPFEFNGPPLDSRSVQVDYLGTNERSRASVGETIAVDLYYTGLEVFGSVGRGETRILGNTGAQTGTGTDTLTGRAALQVIHNTTTYAGASGVAAGLDSAAGDTVIGPAGAHTLTITDTSGTGASGLVSLNGGEAVAFSNSDTNLEVRGSNGLVVYVDTTAIAAGFSGTLNITATGSLSVDEGATSIAIDHSTNQIVADSITGDAVTIDSSQIRVAGQDHLEFGGTSNAFQVLFELSQDLRNSRGLEGAELSLAVDRRLADLEAISSRAFDRLAEQSTALSSLRSLGERVDTLQDSIESELADVSSADLTDAVLQLENSQALLQYTYAVSATLTNLSLLDFLR